MKYLKKFETHAQYEAYIGGEPLLPNVSVCDDIANKVYFNPLIVQPNDEIWYTSTDGNIVTPNSTTVFGATIISNTYEDGKGIIKFDGDVTGIGFQAFQGCSSLASITIPNSVTSIGIYTFQRCSSLASITLPNSVTSIGNYAFQDCSSLASITISNSVTSIGSRTFYFCRSLTDFNYEGTISQWNNVTLGGNWKVSAPFTVVHCSDGDSTRLS